MSTTLAPSTTYTASTATVVYTPSSTGLIATQTITLQPQTTQWSPPKACDSTTIWCNSRPNEVKESLDCYQYNFVNASQNTYLKPDCYPSGYVDIFSRQRKFSDIQTLAFPGTACPSGWSVPAQGCSGTMVAGSLLTQQLYCCPTGFDGCDLNGGAQRDCFKNLATSTTVWVRGRGTSDPNEAITYTPDPQFPVRVIHAVFPLAIAVVTTSDAGPSPTSGSPNGGGADSGNNGSGPANSQAGLSPGIVAGIVIGVVAGLALICAIIFFIFMRRRRAAEVRHSIVPRRATASNSVLPENGGSGPYDPYAPGGQPSPGLYFDPKMLGAAMAAASASDPAVSRWHSPATVGAYPATARSTSPYDPHDPSNKSTHEPEQQQRLDSLQEQGMELMPTAGGGGGDAVLLKPEVLLPGMPPGNVEVAELESHPLDRIPVEIDSSPSTVSYVPTPGGGPVSALTTTTSPLRSIDSTTGLSPPQDGRNGRRF